MSQRWRGSLLAILVFSVYNDRAGSLSLHSCLGTTARLLGRPNVQGGDMGSKPIRFRTSIRSSPATTRPESGLLGKSFLGTYGVSVRSTFPSLPLLTKISILAQTSLLRPMMSGQGNTAGPGDSTVSALWVLPVMRVYRNEADSPERKQV